MKTITRFESWYVYSDGVVRINDGVEKVPEWSFENMEGVKEIIIPDSVFEIGTGAFSNSTVQSIVLPSGLKCIGDDAFSDCDALEQINFPPNVEYVGSRAFKNCSKMKLKRLVFPHKVKHIGDQAFCCCDGLEEVVVESNPLTHRVRYEYEKGALPDISSDAFQECQNVRFFTMSLRLAETLGFKLEKNLSDGAFPGYREEGYRDCCTDVTFDREGHIVKAVVPEWIEYIPSKAFGGCRHLEIVAFPHGLKGVGDYAFNGCNRLSCIIFSYKFKIRLSKLTIRDVVDFGESNIVYVGKSAFSHTGFKHLIIPEQVKYVDEDAFAECEALEKLE